MKSTLTIASVTLLLGSATVALSEARAHPFRGEYGPVMDLGKLVCKARAGQPQQLLSAIRRDPHLTALALDYPKLLRQARDGQLSQAQLMDSAAKPIRSYVRAQRSELQRVFRRDASKELEQLIGRKLWVLGGLLQGKGEQATAGKGAPERSPSVKKLFGRKSSTLPLAPTPDVQSLFGGARGLKQFGWEIATGRGRTRAESTARVEVGRAVFVADVDLDPSTGNVTPAAQRRPANVIRTQILDKGVGPTKYAGNRFSRRQSGVFTLMQGERDLEISQRLKAGGVPVYQPLGLLALPYWDWHPAMGWRPMAKYARVPEENLRVSDLHLLSKRARKGVLGELRAKIAALAGVSSSKVSEYDVVLFFAARLGRIAGLFEGGRSFGGKRFFHGMLHVGNVSLLAEMVDFSESPGFFSSKRAWQKAYAESLYRSPRHAYPAWLKHARSEEAVFRFVLAHFVEGLRPAMAPDQQPPGGLVAEIYRRAHKEGLAGAAADDGAAVLRSARKALAK